MMIRNLKALGLVLVALFAMGAGMASAASAETAQFTAGASGQTVHVDGEQTGAGDRFTLAGIGAPENTCAVATLKGTATGPETSTVTLTPNYETCHAIVTILGAKVTRTMTITMNGCDYEFRATKNTASTPFSADVTIVCPTGQTIEIHVYGNGNASDTGASTICTYIIHHQTINNAIQLTNVAGPPMDILMHMNLGLTVTNVTPNATCSTSTSLTYTGTDTIRATNGAGEFIDLTVS